MADIFSRQKRSWVMSRIRSRDTGIEKKTAQLLRKNKLHYRRFPKLFGSPDFIVEKKILVFCDGDFWHGYQYNRKKKPPKKFWRDKIERNMERDRKVTRRLRADGWPVVRLWEHDIERNPGSCLRRMKTILYDEKK
uniref:DNA G/T mismatch repair endonuclease (Vsr) n=1 Tax=uncultured marine thaumarchaeote KM3_200_B02 TaxID=1456093 RepID=A0A075GY60_9ARCH|nr:DNA G/T mismatch repair endonuclease (vsr) [uncultured marine thaumarchaeote KM3_200_B02]